MLKNIDLNRDHISTSEASKRSNLSMIYLRHLLRQRTLEGFQMGRDWFVYTDSLEKFLATPRKSGPKGPRKKNRPEAQSATAGPENNAMKTDLPEETNERD
jgi:hypothetical protein